MNIDKHIPVIVWSIKLLVLILLIGLQLRPAGGSVKFVFFGRDKKILSGFYNGDL